MLGVYTSLLATGCASKPEPAVASAGQPPLYGPVMPAPTPGAPAQTQPWWTPWAPPASLPGASALPQLSHYEAEVVRLVNEQRQRGAVCGGQPRPPVAPLVVMPQLTGAARGHSWDMAMNNYMDHRSADGRTLADRVRAAGFAGRLYGENIARGYPTPTAVMAGWMESPGHCENIMSYRFRYIGVGYAFTPVNAQQHHWTQNFGG